SGATGVSGTTALTATFSEAMTAGSIGASSFELRDASNQLVGATVSYNASTFAATLTPSAALTSGATYTATIRGGPTDPRVKDPAGTAPAATFPCSFPLAAPPPPTAPSVSPAAGATGVSGTTTVTATFSEAMTAGSIGTSSVELRDASNQLVPAAVAYN